MGITRSSKQPRAAGSGDVGVKAHSSALSNGRGVLHEHGSVLPHESSEDCYKAIVLTLSFYPEKEERDEGHTS